MKKIYLLPNVITAFSLSCGLFTIFKVNMTDSAAMNYQMLMATTGILLLAAFADLLDGAIARAMKAQSDFGSLFDSAADAISFGVAPSVIILKSLSLQPGTNIALLLTIAAMVYSACGVLRLVRYNLMAAQENTGERKNTFTGLPIPAAAAAAVSANLFLASDELKEILTLSPIVRVWIMFAVLIVLGYFMISRWKFPSLKSLQVRVASFQQVFLTVLLAVFIFYGVLSHFTVVFFTIAWVYILVAWILSIIRLISGRKSKTLEDFEPEVDEEVEDLDNV